MNDIKSLWLLNRFEERNFRLRDATDARMARQRLLRDVVAFAEKGKVALVNSGMDCDCSRWENNVSLVKATVKDVDQWIAQFYGNAEGPQSHYIQRPSIAQMLTASSRDLALEAFEDGHQHVVYA